MNPKLLILGVAAAALAAGGASAATHHSKKHMARENYAAPAQPIPYSELDSYVGGSHKMDQAPAAPSTSAPTTPDTSAAPTPK